MLAGCDGLADLGRGSPEQLGGLLDGGVYVNEDTGEAFMLEESGLVFVGTLDGGIFYARGLSAYTVAGRDVRFYAAAAPYLAVDFTTPTFECRLEDSTSAFPRRIGHLANHYDRCDLMYSDALAAMNAELSFAARARLLALAFEARSDPPVAASFVPQQLPEDAGQPAGDGVVTPRAYYARSTLSGKGRLFYDAVYTGIHQMQAEIDVAEYGVSVDDGQRILRYILNDAPELFWWTGRASYMYVGRQVQTILPEYGYTPDEVRALKAEIDAAAAEILASVGDQIGDEEKALRIATALAQRVAYDHVAAKSTGQDIDPAHFGHQTIVGGLVDHLAVCAGIARSYQYLLNRAGIRAFCVTGALSSPTEVVPAGNHAWNMLRVGETWYYADLTNALDTVAAGKTGRFLQRESDLDAMYVFVAPNDPVDPDDDEDENPPLPSDAPDVAGEPARRQLVWDDHGADAESYLKNLVYDMMRRGDCVLDVYFDDQSMLERMASAVARDGAAMARDIPARGGVSACNIVLAEDGLEHWATLYPVYVLAPGWAP